MFRNQVLIRQKKYINDLLPIIYKTREDLIKLLYQRISMIKFYIQKNLEKFNDIFSNCQNNKNKLEYSFKNLSAGASLEITQNNIIQFEKCEACYENICHDNSYCQDTIKILLQRRGSSTFIQSLLNNIYSLRSLNIRICDLNYYMDKADFVNLRKLNKQDSSLKTVSYTDILIDEKRYKYLNDM